VSLKAAILPVKCAVNVAEPTQFLTNEKGERIALVISMEDYEKILDDEELWRSANTTTQKPPESSV
jgi:hypothetical protein